MSSGVTLTAATRQNLLSLQGTADLLSSTQNRLSTGKKVNSALDSPVNFFTAQSLNNRSKDLGGLLDGISNGIQSIQAANQGITSIQKLVDSAKSTASQALSTKSTATGSSATGAVASATVSLSSSLATGSGGTGAAADGTHDFSGAKGASFKVTDGTGKSTDVLLDASHFGNSVSDLTKITAGQVLTEINEQLTAAGGNGAQVKASLTDDGRLSIQSTGTGADSKVTLSAATDAAAVNTVNIGFGVSTPVYPAVANGVDATDGSTKATATGTALTGGAVTFGAASNASFTLQVGDGALKTITLTKEADASLAAGSVTGGALVLAINKQINADTGLSGKVVAAFDSTNNTISLRTTGSGADQKIAVSSIKTTTTLDIGFNLGDTDANIAKGAKSSQGAGSTSANGSNARSALAKQFNELLTQITQQAQDSSYNGVNLLYRSGSNTKENSLHISFNEKDSSSLDITGVKFDASGLGVTNVTGGFSSDEDIKTALTQLTNASATLRSQSSTFGSNLTVVQNRQDFSKQLTNILDTGAANLTNADLNEEAANSQALSTRQSIGISALSLANTAQQGILQLLR